MIVDCHTRIWASPEQMGRGSATWLVRNGGQENLSADPSEHAAASAEADQTLVWGFRSRHLSADVPNAFLADYVAQHREKVIGIAAVDPPEPDAMERLENIAGRSEFAGVTICPAGQGFHPCDTRAMETYAFCQERGLPVFVEMGVELSPQAALEFARPQLLDEVARSFPQLTLLVAAMGRPWVQETVPLLAKHPRVYADVAALVRRPWEAYQALLLAHQCAVTDKLLFGSDFPFSTVATAIEQFYRLNELSHGTNLPTVPREVLRGIVERDALAVLGID